MWIVLCLGVVVCRKVSYRLRSSCKWVLGIVFTDTIIQLQELHFTAPLEDFFPLPIFGHWRKLVKIYLNGKITPRTTTDRYRSGIENVHP